MTIELPKIAEVWLFTNRNTIFFDGNGEQITEAMTAISYAPVNHYEGWKEKDILKKMINDRPKIYIARIQEWKHEISLDEFCSILGHGRWFYDTKNSIRIEAEEKVKGTVFESGHFVKVPKEIDDIPL